MDKKEIIKEYLFKGTPEERKEKFELAWDIYSLLPDFWEEAKKDFFEQYIKSELETILGKQFYVHTFIFKDRVWYFNLPIIQKAWLVNGNPFYVIKMNRYKEGRYELLLERWDKLPSGLMHLEENIIHAVKGMDNTTTSDPDSGNFRVVFRKKFQGQHLKDFDFIVAILEDPESEKKSILNMFREFRNFLNLKVNGRTIEELITNIVNLAKGGNHGLP